MRRALSSLLSLGVLVATTSVLADEGRAEAADERNADPFGPWVPDYARVQTGGYLGTIGIGVGYGAFDDVLNVGLLYGYTHDDVVGGVHAIQLMLSARPFDLRVGREFRIVPAYFGVGVLGTWGERYYLDLPDRYPSDYYRPNAAFPVFHLGLEVDYLPGCTAFERHGLFAELTFLEYYVGRYFRNPDTIDLVDAVGLALGYRAAF